MHVSVLPARMYVLIYVCVRLTGARCQKGAFEPLGLSYTRLRANMVLGIERWSSARAVT